MSAYRAVILDLGKVVFDLSFDLVFQHWAAAAGEPVERIRAGFQFDGLFEEFERGEVTPAAFRAEILARLGLRLTDQQFDAGWGALYLDPYPGIDGLLAELGHNCRLVALTNTNQLHGAVWPGRYAPQLRHFRRVFCSHELRARKPEAPAYQVVLDYLRVEPGQAVFLDDSPDNVAGAARLGLEAVLVTSVKQLAAELRRRELLGPEN